MGRHGFCPCRWSAAARREDPARRLRPLQHPLQGRHRVKRGQSRPGDGRTVRLELEQLIAPVISSSTIAGPPLSALFRARQKTGSAPASASGSPSRSAFSIFLCCRHAAMAARDARLLTDHQDVIDRGGDLGMVILADSPCPATGRLHRSARRRCRALPSAFSASCGSRAFPRTMITTSTSPSGLNGQVIGPFVVALLVDAPAARGGARRRRRAARARRLVIRRLARPADSDGPGPRCVHPRPCRHAARRCHGGSISSTCLAMNWLSRRHWAGCAPSAPRPTEG